MAVQGPNLYSYSTVCNNNYYHTFFFSFPKRFRHIMDAGGDDDDDGEKGLFPSVIRSKRKKALPHKSSGKPGLVTEQERRP